jgi:CheY-like chemotaxis protein
MNDNSVSILIAEDDPEDMDLIADAIAAAEPRAYLHKFEDGLSAVEYLRTRSDNDLPSLIILDYNMPGLTGAQVLRSISTEERYKPIPKVVLSTSNAALHKHECMRSGASGYFVKPGSLKELNQLAKTIVDLHRS